ncbi:MAG: hypothetical protein HKN82_20180 [Akkermansiaceae bacterium]|nr:hypothetical protein [Akkermansiaceae bacterium]NNM29415.1 hypothetical protein [Akkermansiaceae bacterium]
MRKTFPLEVPGLKPPRVIEAIKHEIRRYLKRERRKSLPEEADFWDFDCRAGRDEGTAVAAHVSELTAAIDRAGEEGWPAIYLEILAKPARRTPKPGLSGEEEE